METGCLFVHVCVLVCICKYPCFIRLICSYFQKLERLQPWMGWWVWWRTGWQTVNRPQTAGNCMSVCSAIRSASAMPSTPSAMNAPGRAGREN